MSSITDNPIQQKGEDLLKVEKYSQALSNFISRSDTPITIGLQGEWGTGKTSLMSLLLEDFNEKNIACSWVNTWEYSMFRGANETTPGVLKGMLEKLKESCIKRKVWTLKDESNATFKKLTNFVGNIMNQAVVNHTGLDIKAAADLEANSKNSTAEIAEIKELISGLIHELINDSNNSIQKVVFFVDDLDRIPPSDAVEVLEALKNIFDIPNCVFILAIDYDVVVKGLENKFGQKTEENEREFRSFFDKIIQVPFSMPTGTYDIENFLVEKLNYLGIQISNEEIELYTRTIKHSIGANPRSLKRYLNSFSLINHLKELELNEDEPNGDNFMLFALLGIQISYPKIFRLLTQKSNFTEWNKGFGNKFGLDWETTQDKIKSFGESELLDEEWEQVAWGVCQTESYLKARAFSVLELLNLLRIKFGENLEEELERAMEFAAITSVDDDIATKQAVQKVGNKTIYNGIETKLLQLEEDGYHQEAIENWKKFWTALNEKISNNSNLRISFAKTGCGFYNDSLGGRGKNQLFYTDNPSNKSYGVKINMTKNTGKVNFCFKKYLEKYNLHDLKDSFYIDNTEKKLVLQPSLFEKLGKEQYQSLIIDLADEVH